MAFQQLVFLAGSAFLFVHEHEPFYMAIKVMLDSHIWLIKGRLLAALAPFLLVVCCALTHKRALNLDLALRRAVYLSGESVLRQPTQTCVLQNEL